MSIEGARGFLARLAEDAQFRKGLGDCKTEDEQLKFALRAGFNFTSVELRTARGELQDADLDGITGGASIASTCLQETLCGFDLF